MLSIVKANTGGSPIETVSSTEQPFESAAFKKYMPADALVRFNESELHTPELSVQLY